VKLEHFGAFATLEEYDNKEGLIHIAQISSGWVKHLRDHVREGQKIVCKVLNVDERRGHIDLSLKEVKDSQKRQKIKEWKNEKKAKKWLTLALAAPDSKRGLSPEELEAVETTLLDAYGSLYDAFEDVVRAGTGAVLGISAEDADAIHEVACANVKLPSVQINGYVELRCPSSDGVERIKEALTKAEEVLQTRPAGEGKTEEVTTSSTTVECFYIGAPRYKIRVKAPDYKEAESILSDAANAAIAVIKGSEGSGKFYRNLPR
jgi:translation initiation factor 2 subunit 1